MQIGLGGLVAGLKAGLIYDTWPMIDGVFIPSAERLFSLAPAWTNLVDNHLTVQFVHRMAAYLLVVFTCCMRSMPRVAARPPGQARSRWLCSYRRKPRSAS